MILYVVQLVQGVVPNGEEGEVLERVHVLDAGDLVVVQSQIFQLR